MCQKLTEIKWPILKQELLTMLVLKFGEISHMTVKAIFGHSAALYIKWQHLSHHFKVEICKTYLTASKKQN